MTPAERRGQRNERARVLRLIERMADHWHRRGEPIVWGAFVALHEYIEHGPKKLAEAAARSGSNART